MNQCPLVLQHEKYSSQLQMNLKVLEGRKEPEDRPRTPGSKSVPQGNGSTRSPSRLLYCHTLQLLVEFTVCGCGESP